eukprot:738486-Amphidinium_carterae.1
MSGTGKCSNVPDKSDSTFDHSSLLTYANRFGCLTRSAGDNDGYRYCYAAIDMLTKLFFANPVEEKREESVSKVWKT